MASETSDPGGQDTVDQMEEENAIAGMTDAQSQAQMSEMGLSGGFGNYAGSTSLSNQMNSSITGSRVTDALVPGVGTLSLISAISAQYMQANVQRGASLVYGSSGNVEGTLGSGLFGGTVYSGNPDLDPNRSAPDNSNDNVATNRKQFMGEIHEFAITDGFTDKFASTDTLTPTFRNILLYYRFEEIDL